jgi:hypothetical protein
VAGERFGPYRLDEVIGRGGMGEVYRAYDTLRDRTVAVKCLPRHLAGDRGFEAQFRRESRIVARLREPHIIPIHDFGEIDGRLFIDMRLVDGIDLASLLRRDGPLPPGRAVSIIAQVAGALAAAHAEGLVHRDVKPANVLVNGAERGEDHAYLVDFGIARDASATEFGPAGGMVGSAEYMAPEQFAEGHADHRSDIYSLGCLLYTALTGDKPFPGDGPAAQMYAHLNSPPPAPSARAPVPIELDRVVAHAMAKDPAERPANVTEFAAAARAALAGGEPPVRRTGRSESRPSLPFGAGALRVLGWSGDPALVQFGRRVADQAVAVATGLGIAAERERPTHPHPEERGALRISLVVAEEVSKKTINAVSELFWTKLRSSMATLRDAGTEGREPSAETMVFTTVFNGESDRTVIEVRVPVSAVERSDLDLRRLIADAHAAASAQAVGTLRAKHVTVSADPTGSGATVLDVKPCPPDAAYP